MLASTVLIVTDQGGKPIMIWDQERYLSPTKSLLNKYEE